MRKVEYPGILTKIRMVKEDALLVRFSLDMGSSSIYCIVAIKNIAQGEMFLKNDAHKLHISGYWNLHEQFVVKTLKVENPDEIIALAGL